MSLQELKAYSLNHRDDDDAFYAYVDRLNAEGKWIEVPASDSFDELDSIPELMKKLSKDPGRKQ